jgi:hypothetical protein
MAVFFVTSLTAVSANAHMRGGGHGGHGGIGGTVVGATMVAVDNPFVDLLIVPLS